MESSLYTENNRNSPIPIYHQVSTHLQNRILKQEWGINGKIPTESELMQSYGVSRNTIRKALASLEEDGLIKCVRGSGAYVQRLPERICHDFGLPSAICAKLGQHGIRLNARILDLSIYPNTPYINTLLKLDSSQSIVYIKRLFLHSELAIALNESWISLELVPDIIENGLINDHLSITLSQRYNLTPVSIQNTIEAVTPSASEVTELNVNYNIPLIAITSLSFLPYSLPLEYSRTVWRGDCVKFNFVVD